MQRETTGTRDTQRQAHGRGCVSTAATNGIALKNGYLQVASNADVEASKQNLPNMTVVGVRDVPVRGLDRSRNKYAKDEGRTVDLIYTSAVPVVDYDTIPSTALSKIADLTLLAQYTGSMLSEANVTCT